jgi:hypothetical protein
VSAQESTEPRDPTLVIPLDYLDGMKQFAVEQGESVLASCIDRMIAAGITVNVPYRQVGAMAETLRPLVEEPWMHREREQEADFTPSGVNG